MKESKSENHRSGFVSIIGRPNAGKSTLLNALVGEKMAIVTHKPQTTRHRMIAILSGEDFQVVFSDTPGYVEKPSYRMHQVMNNYVSGTLEDADLLLFLMDVNDPLSPDDDLFRILLRAQSPIVLVLNKIDLISKADLEKMIKDWGTLTVTTDDGDVQTITWDKVLAISAEKGIGTEELLKDVIAHLPQGPEYYPKDQLTDRPERFFTAEIIREQILLQYSKEIPYSVEVSIEEFKDTKTNAGLPLARIRTVIYVERKTQIGILLGHQGRTIKKLGSAARMQLEEFLQRKVYLEITVKEKSGWRDNEGTLRWLGY